MRKHLKKLSVLMILFGMSLTTLSAASYSKVASVNKIIGNYTFTFSEKATYYTSGVTRWTYTNQKMVPVGSVNLLSYRINSSEEIILAEIPNYQRTQRKLTGVTTTHNYTTSSGSAYLTWSINLLTNQFD